MTSAAEADPALKKGFMGTATRKSANGEFNRGENSFGVFLWCVSSFEIGQLQDRTTRYRNLSDRYHILLP